jgi:GTP cyclohydrolase I
MDDHDCYQPETSVLLPDTEMDYNAIEDAVAQVLLAIGEDPCREGLKRTPERVARM